MESLSASDLSAKLRNTNVTTPLGPIARYNLRYTILLTLVPLVCGLTLMLLLTVFAKLNLYYLEASGMLVNDEVRDAYFAQVQVETMGVAGFLALQMLMTAAVSIVVMRWASAPFTSALRTVETALAAPANLRPSMRMLSESPGFDRVIWLFALRVKNGGENQIKEGLARYTANLLFLAKFALCFGALSVVTGRFMEITLGHVYDKVVALAIQLVKNTNLGSAQHYFSAQQDVLQDASRITTGISLLVYLVMGLNIARYMSTMIFVFSRALEEDRFPIQLRTDDVYHGLAASLNKARERIR